MEEKYILQTPKGEWDAYNMYGRLVPHGLKRWGRGGGFMCSCTGTTQETATPYETKIQEGAMVCPKCGKRLEIIKTPEDFRKEEAEKQRKELENLRVVEVNYSWESGIKLFALSTRIGPKEWAKVAHLFSFWRATEDEEDDEEWYDDYVGYATRNPKEVERILCIPEKRSLEFQEKLSEKRRIEREREQKAEEMRGKEERDQGTKKLEKLLQAHFGGKEYVQSSVGDMAKGKKIAEFTPGLCGSYPRWSAYEQKTGGGMVVFHEHNSDFWQDYLYATKLAVVAEEEREIQKSVEIPCDYLIVTIFFHKTSGKQGHDFSCCYGSQHFLKIAESQELSEKAISNFRKKMTDKRLSEKDREYPASVRSYWQNSEREACELMGILLEATRARECRVLEAKKLWNLKAGRA